MSIRTIEEMEIGYSTLTRLIRDLGIGQKADTRCHQVDDVPGEEMQHDTTPFKLKIGDTVMAVILSGLYLRYCKMRYIKFYRHFNRFRMKSFFHEALRFWGYSARICVIDNTSLAVLRGTGNDAVFHPEMEAFAKPHGFTWMAHEKGHSNRRAGTERSFWTVETNFLPGRTFKSIEDLNRQAFEWATSLYARRPLSRTRLIPVTLFEEEKPYLLKLPDYVEPPCQSHSRDIDQYGYVAFNKFTPRGTVTNPYEPKHIQKPCHEEERHLRALGSPIGEYLDFVRSGDSGVKQTSKFIRQLYGLCRNTAPGLFIAVISRARKIASRTSLKANRINH